LLDDTDGDDDVVKDREAKKIYEQLDSCITSAGLNASRGLVAELTSLLADMHDTSNQSTILGKFNAVIINNFHYKVAEIIPVFSQYSKELNVLLEQVFFKMDKEIQLFPKLQLLTEFLKTSGSTVIISSEFYRKYPQDLEGQSNLLRNLQKYSDIVAELKKILISQEGVFGVADLLNGARIL
jgi:hypothetical protein